MHRFAIHCEPYTVEFYRLLYVDQCVIALLPTIVILNIQLCTKGSGSHLWYAASRKATPPRNMPRTSSSKTPAVNMGEGFGSTSMPKDGPACSESCTTSGAGARTTGTGMRGSRPGTGPVYASTGDGVRGVSEIASGACRWVVLLEMAVTHLYV